MTEATRRYLLGMMSEPDEAQFEQEVVADAARHEEVDASTSELIDDYDGGRLTPVERAAVERRLLATPTGRLRLRAARALHRRAAAVPRPVRWRRWTLFAAPVLAAAAAVALWCRPPAGMGQDYTLALERTTRASSVPELALPADAAFVHLALPLTPDEAGAATGVVELVGAGKHLTEKLAPHAEVVVPVGELAPGAWELTVETTSGPIYFSFRIR